MGDEHGDSCGVTETTEEHPSGTGSPVAEVPLTELPPSPSGTP